MGGDLGAKVAPHQMKAQIQPRCRSCRGEYVSVIDVEHVRVNVNRRVTSGQFSKPQASAWLP